MLAISVWHLITQVVVVGAVWVSVTHCVEHDCFEEVGLKS